MPLFFSETHIKGLAAPECSRSGHSYTVYLQVQALDAGEVPASLVARMVKYKLLRMEKKELQSRAEAKVRSYVCTCNVEGCLEPVEWNNGTSCISL